jgi:hypothetical protein
MSVAKSVFFSAFVGLATMTVANVARADETAPAKSQRGVIVLDTTVVTGHGMRPLVSIEVTRIEPQLTITELRIPLLERIEAAIYEATF